jgi:tape measure domain-containing protein
MAALTADKVIVELEARVNKYNADVKAAETNFDRSVKGMAASSEAAERRIMASSSGIKRALLATAATLAASFSVSAVREFADSYTRYTNQLKLAGLEGQRLVSTQESLFGVAQKYGVALEGLGTLYGRLSQAGKELGASDATLLQFTTGVAAALKVQGGSAESTQGALLQLSQALGGAIVRAEEFNSINEGARPIVQAVANGIDRFGGSVSKLRNEVIKGKVSSEEFFQGALKGFAKTEVQAEKANLTIAASFQVLNNALGKYIGQADSALSASAKVSEALTLLANNLDHIIPVITTIAALIGTRYVGALVAKTAATVTSSIADVQAALAVNALAAANARLVASGGAATASMARATASVTAYGIASGVAARTASGLGVLLGGPVGIALLAVTAAFTGLAYAAGEGDRHNKEIVATLDGGRPAIDRYRDATEKLTKATDAQRVAAQKAADVARQQAEAELKSKQAKLDSAKASLVLMQAEAARLENVPDNARNFDEGGGAPELFARQASSAQANRVKALQTVVDEMTAQIAEIAKPPAEVKFKPVDTKGKNAAANAARQALEHERKAQDDILRAQQDRAGLVIDRAQAELEAAAADVSLDADTRKAKIATAAANLALANAADRQAAIQLDRIERDRAAAVAEVALETKWTDAQRKKVTDAINEAALADRSVALAEEAVRRAEAQAKAKGAINDARRTTLDARAGDAALPTAERIAAERELIDLAHDEARARLEIILAVRGVDMATKERARSELEASFAAKPLADADNQLLDLRQEGLRLQQDQTRSLAARRRVDDEILKIAQQQRRAQADILLAQLDQSAAANELRDKTHAALAAIEDAEREGSRRSNRSPLETLSESRSNSRSETGDRANAIAARGLEGLGSALAKASLNAEGFGQSLLELGTSLVEEVLTDVYNQFVVAPLADLLNKGIASLFGDTAPKLAAAAVDGQATAATATLALAINALNAPMAALVLSANAAAAALASVAASQAASGITSSLSAGFGGARAAGGPVKRGLGYMVGENGPEPFFPGVDGTIVANGMANRPAEVQRQASVGGGNLTVINKGPPMKATRERDDQGNTQLNLEPLANQAIESAGKSGRLKKALNNSPQPKRRA